MIGDKKGENEEGEKRVYPKHVINLGERAGG